MQWLQLSVKRGGHNAAPILETRRTCRDVDWLCCSAAICIHHRPCNRIGDVFDCNAYHRQYQLPFAAIPQCLIQCRGTVRVFRGCWYTDVARFIYAKCSITFGCVIPALSTTHSGATPRAWALTATAASPAVRPFIRHSAYGS